MLERTRKDRPPEAGSEGRSALSMRTWLAVVLAIVLAACTTTADTTTTSGEGSDTTTAPGDTTAPADTTDPGDDDESPLVLALGEWGATETSLGWEMDANNAQLWHVIYDPILDRNPETREITPTGLFVGWENSDDYTVWTFEIREGVQWHNDWGELTADDVVYTVERNLDEGARGSQSAFFRQNLASIEALDDYTVQMTFNSGVWEVPRHLYYAPFNINSRAYVEEVGDDVARAEPVGTGGYRWVSGIPGQEHHFEAVEDHWRAAPEFAKLTVRLVPDNAARLAGLRAGEIDIAPMAGDLLLQGIDSGLGVHEVKNASQVVLHYRGTTSDPATGDFCPECPWVGDQTDPESAENARKVREAMSLAVNREALIDAVFGGFATLDPMIYYYYPQIRGFREEWSMPEQDQEAARALLEEAGYPDGFTIRMNPLADPVYGPDITQAVAQDLGAIGINVEQVPEELATFQPKIRERDTGPTASAHRSVYIFDDPGAAWANVARSTAPNGTYMPDFYTDDVNEILAELDEDRRRELTIDLAQTLYDEHWDMYIAFASATWLKSDRVGEWDTLPGNGFTNRVWTIQKAN